MNGPHDLGGQTGFGPILPETEEPVFNYEWEGRALGVSLCAAWVGGWTLDENRHAYELIAPADYLRASYYEIWIRGLDHLLQKHGIITSAELFGDSESIVQTAPVSNILTPSEVDAMLAAAPSEMETQSAPSFSTGDTVVTRDINPCGHTRLPRYARGKIGQVQAVQGFYTYPDDNAHGRGKNPQWLYTVTFTGQELWGDQAEAGLIVSIDAWESYLAPARVSRNRLTVA